MGIPCFQRNVAIVLVVFFTLIVIFKTSTRYGTPSSIEALYPNAIGSTTHSKNAYVVFLNGNANSAPEFHGKADIQSEDHYFTGTRMLLYQLRHAPETRTNTSIPFIVLVSENVPKSHRDQLTSEGAIVKEVEHLKFDWIKPNRERWGYVMDKLHVFNLVEYEKILLLDTDIVVTQRIDGIFDDPAAQLSDNLGDTTKMEADEGPQPKQYIMAGNCGPAKVEHPYPAPRGNRLNAGFVLLKPSVEMFRHYVAISSIENRFKPGSPEQNLWNYVHDRSRNMPWKQLHGDWNVNTPNFNDYQNGVKTFHEKYWIYNTESELRDVLLKSRWKMDGFFERYHAKH